MSQQQTQEHILRALSNAIGELKDPRVPLIVTVERIHLAKDLSKAKVYLSTLGNMAQLLEALESAKGHLQRELAGRVQMRKTPLLEFVDASVTF